METVASPTLDIAAIRAQFPVLHQQVHGKPLVYFDNAATTQKPQRVIDALVNYYTQDNANIHRGIHALAERATQAYEDTRKALANFINAAEPAEIVFTRGTTEGVNLVASAWGRQNIQAGDEIIVSAMEHHSNMVPWQILCEEKGATLKIAPINEAGELLIDEFEKLLTPKTKLVSMVYVSNSLGTINPVEDVIHLAHANGSLVMLDSAQATSKIDIDVQALDVDFLALSGHKMYGPTGVGALYGKRTHLEAMTPYQGGGEMIKDVSYERSTYNEIPYKFEAGTPNIADVVALKAALEFIEETGRANIRDHEHDLVVYGHEVLAQIDGFRPYGTAQHKASVISFLIDGVHPYDLGMMLDAKGIAVRTGHHCTQPLMDWYNIEGTVRASFAVYNTREEIDRLAEGLDAIVKKLR
ncbi:MAG TPA: cysteine desulfurase CsdA [Cytophagales bacterium]|nr:cysteine desulfurase CsdA [Cytophagales bacterium]